jgi:uncharacterized protein YqgC (DUF456 family)
MSWALAVVLVVIGLAGVILPGLPGTILVFLGLLLAAWSDRFNHVGILTMAVLGILTGASYFVDLVFMTLGMKRWGASKRAMLGAAIGASIGIFFGIPGLIVGPFAGAVIGELTVDRALTRAGRAGLAAWVGFLVGTIVKISLAFAMVGIFLAVWFAS